MGPSWIRIYVVIYNGVELQDLSGRDEQTSQGDDMDVIPFGRMEVSRLDDGESLERPLGISIG